MADMTIQLVQKWSDWEAGAVLTLEKEKAKRVIAKGYAEPFKPVRGRPRVETATLKPAAERAVVAPVIPDKTDLD